MNEDLVIGIDSSTTAAKAIAWDGLGNNIAEGCSPIPLSLPRSDHYEQDPEDWWRSFVTALHELMGKVDKKRIKALAIANQRETFVPLDKEGKPLRPAIIWLDERCKGQVDSFAGIIGEEHIHRITGKPKDYAPVVYRLAWMKDHEEELYRKTYKFCDVHTYLVYRLTGHFHTSWASIDPFGIMDLKAKRWSPEILDGLEIMPDQLPVFFSPGTILGEITGDVAEVTGILKGTPVVAGGGDGQSAGLGVNALGADRAYLNMGTAVVSGTYIKEYITDKAFRTIASCSEKGYYCETSLRAGTFLIDWFIKKILKIDTAQQKDIYMILEQEAGEISPGSDGLLVLPYWNAVMNPYWDPDARGCIAGLTSGHHRGHIYRAMLEGIAMEQVLATEALEEVAGVHSKEYAIMGGGARSPLWKQIIADVSGKKIVQMVSEEATALGAGIAAAVAARWFPSFGLAAGSMTHVKEVVDPVPGNMHRYREMLKIYRRIYKGMCDIFYREGGK